MRMLHTSDWHLGRMFHGASLLDEQREAVDSIVGLTEEAGIDLVVVAGDLYDRALPPSEAVELWNDALRRLRGTGAKVVAIAGNHDSASRVSMPDELLGPAGVAVRGDVSLCVQPFMVDADDGGSPVAVYPVPYFEPSSALRVLQQIAAGEPAVDGETVRSTHHDTTALAMSLIRSHAAAADEQRSVVVAHTFVSGGEASESERDISVGSVDLVGLSAFDGFGYVALGHLHGSQQFDGGRVAYSGTPLPYSFSEERHSKSVRIVEMDPRGQCSTEVVPLKVGRRLRTLTGKFDELLSSAAFADAEQARVRFEVTDRDLPLQSMTRLQQRFPHAVALQHIPEGRAAVPVDADSDAAAAVHETETPFELILRFWEERYGAEASEDQTAVLRQAIAAAEKEDDQ